MRNFERFGKDLAGVRQTKERGFTMVEIMIVIAIIAIMAAYGIPAYMTRVERARGMETAAFFKDIKEAQSAFAATRDSFYPIAGGAILSEQNIARALGINFTDSKNFAFKIQTGSDSTCGNWLQIEAEPMSTQGSGAATVTNITTRNSAPESWAVTKATATQSVTYQTPMPSTGDANAVLGWEAGINMGNWLDSSMTSPFGTIVTCR